MDWQIWETGQEVDTSPGCKVTLQAFAVTTQSAACAKCAMPWSTARLTSQADLERLRSRITGRQNPKRVSIITSVGTCSLARGGGEVADAIDGELQERGLSDSVDLRRTGCHGFCDIEPVVVIYPEGIVYQQVTPADVPEIITESVLRRNIVDRLLYTDPSTGQKCLRECEIPFYRKQRSLLLEGNRFIDPHRIEDYIAQGGYSALSTVLSQMPPDEVVEEIGRSRLRSRGGSGLPVSKKWQACHSAPSSDGNRYVICNVDEGDSSAHVDRSLLEGNPHSIIEGMIIGAYAVNSHFGYVSVRSRYPLAINNLVVSLEQARGHGLLGDDILGSGFDFDISISCNEGAFICNASPAPVTSSGGRASGQQLNHIGGALQGFNDCPIALDNAETWANVPIIIGRGARWYSTIGTGASKGTKVFALVGTTRNTGLVEVPMGTTLRELVYDIGGGIRGGKKLKAVQTGGLSGSFIPESQIDLPVDFDRLMEAGSSIGSGSMVVMDEHNCMVDMARYVIRFLTEESCGKCTGGDLRLDIMLRVLTDITEGRGRRDDITLLEELGNAIKEASPCALGAMAPNPVLSTIRHFREEYRAHVFDHRCPAGVCKALITFSIDAERCIGCRACARECPQQAILGEKKKPQIIDQQRCIKCRICLEFCKSDAIVISGAKTRHPSACLIDEPLIRT